MLSFDEFVLVTLILATYREKVMLVNLLQLL